MGAKWGAGAGLGDAALAEGLLDLRGWFEGFEVLRVVISLGRSGWDLDDIALAGIGKGAGLWSVVDEEWGQFLLGLGENLERWSGLWVGLGVTVADELVPGDFGGPQAIDGGGLAIPLPGGLEQELRIGQIGALHELLRFLESAGLAAGKRATTGEKEQ